MLRRPLPRTGSSSPDLTPVVNIAMVVLVVFMLTASFVEPQLYMRSNVALLEKGGTSQLPPDWSPPTPLPVLVDMDPNAPSSFTATVGSQQVADANGLQSLLKQRFDAFQQTGADMKNVQVEISPRRYVIWQHLISVYEAAQLAGFSNITFTPGR